MADETARNFAPSRRVASHQESDGCESQRPRVVERRYKLFDAPRIDLSAGESFEPCRSRFPCPVGHSTNPSCPFLLPRFRCQDQWIGCHQWWKVNDRTTDKVYKIHVAVVSVPRTVKAKRRRSSWITVENNLRSFCEPFNLVKIVVEDAKNEKEGRKGQNLREREIDNSRG